MTQSLPIDPTGLTPAWVSQALDARHPGVRISAIEVLEQRGSTNHHVRLGLAYDERAGAPDTLFCKMASLDPAHRIAVGATGMGAREARFYADLASSIAMRTPTSYFAASDVDGAFLLLLEDLKATGCSMSDGTWGIPPDLAAGALEDLAKLHAQFEDAASLATVRPWISANSPGGSEFTTNMLRHVIDNHRDVLSDAYVAVGEMYIADPNAVIALWERGPQTLIHGDAHIGNLFIDGTRVGFLDWGLMTVMPAMRDVSYFLTMGMMTEDRRPVERDLVQHYLDVRHALGGTRISFDDAWREHRVQTGYTVLASFLSLVPPYNGPDQRAFSDGFRNRAIAALDDLDAASAMREALD
jgi:Phosphotransferase enzyme family